MADKTAPQTGPQVFAIGLPYSGETVVAALFKANGYAWSHYRGGKLARNLAFCHAAGKRPFSALTDVAGVSGLHYAEKRHLPPVAVGDHLGYLIDQFPDAYFIITRRDPADWIAERYHAEEGNHRITAAWHAQCTPEELPAVWETEDDVHAKLCAKLFANNPRYIDFNVNAEPIDKIANFFDPNFHFKIRNALPRLDMPKDLIAAVPAPSIKSARREEWPESDMSFATQVSEFCAQTMGHSGKKHKLSRTAITWERSGKITDRTGTQIPFAQKPDETYICAPHVTAFERAEATLNEMIQHGARRPLHIDMMDARILGTPERRNPPVRSIAYNRRVGAVNFTLWPLPGYHSLAPTGTNGGFPRDEIAFENKEDRCVWLGNMTGRMSDVRRLDDRPLRGVYALRDHAETLAPDSPEWADLRDDFNCVTRYSIVQTYKDHPDFNVGLVLRGRWRKLAETPIFQGLCDPLRPRTWFHKYRYILSLAGNDTGSNFLSAASSNALILKEEDGWELFYTDAFKPWVHYVPLALGAQDVEEKLSWARANPDKCRAMVAASSELFEKFANPNNREAILTAITARLNADLD